MKRNFTLCTVLVASTVMIGCNKEKQQATPSSSSGKVQNPQRETSVVSPSNVEAQSPATLVEGADSSAATPEEVVTGFLEALRSGNDKSAERLLSDEARYSTAREGYEVRPPGTPSASYQVGAAEFVSETKDGAHVPSQWTETFPDGTSEGWEITWVLRRQLHVGWRITGMRAQLFRDAPKRFLNFEDAAEMKRQLAQAEQDLANGSDGVRQASSQNDPTNGQFKNAFPK